MPYNPPTNTDTDAPTTRQPAPPHSPTSDQDEPRSGSEDWSSSPPSPTGPTGTDTPWWPSWNPPSARHRRRRDRRRSPASDTPWPGEEPPRAAGDEEEDVIRAAFLVERESRLESVDHLLSFAAPRAAEAEPEASPAQAAEVTLLGTAEILEQLATELQMGGEREREWARVDAALTALVVLGCGGARVGAVGVGACVVCYARVANVVFRPCGHLVLCSACALLERVGGKGVGKRRRQAVCPVPDCGKAVEQTVKTYRG